MIFRWLCATFATLALFGAGAGAVKSEPAWQVWSPDLFTRAKVENRFVILDLVAVWCHWCHVMEEKTYSNSQVQKLLASRYIPVRVDADADPALSSRYGDWGWPATIIFAPDGSELVKRRGYIPPEGMQSLLQAVIDDPTPGPSVEPAEAVQPSTSAFLTETQVKAILAAYNEAYDGRNGGWGSGNKYIDADSLDYAFQQIQSGDTTATRRARQTLNAALKLIDPIWGGAYQYSDKDDWSSPHFEKIMSYQAQYMRQYSYGYELWHDAAYKKAATDIYRYITAFLLSPDGAFYTSQDADLSEKIDGHNYYKLDDATRRKLGIPRIDKNIYARENGWAIRGLLAYWGITGEKAVLDRAVTAAKWVLAHRSLPKGGFMHRENDLGHPFLADNLAMQDAFIALYAATGDRQWLRRAREAANFIDDTFKYPEAGFITARIDAAREGAFTTPVRNVDENVQLARLANLLNRYTGDARYKAMAEHAMYYLGSNQVTNLPRFLIGVALASEELATEPVHITIVGHKTDRNAATLHLAAWAYPAIYKRVDWWDKSEGPMPNPDIEYPELPEAAAFACANNICSLPVFKPDDLDAAVRRMNGQKTTAGIAP